MCLAVPGKVVKIDGVIGVVEVGGIRRQANLELLDRIRVGDYIILHAGFGIQRLDEDRAEETLSLLSELADRSGALQNHTFLLSFYKPARSLRGVYKIFCIYII